MFCLQDEQEIEKAREEFKLYDADYREWAAMFDQLRKSTKLVFSKTDSKTWVNFLKHYSDIKRSLL